MKAGTGMVDLKYRYYLSDDVASMKIIDTT